MAQDAGTCVQGGWAAGVSSGAEAGRPQAGAAVPDAAGPRPAHELFFFPSSLLPGPFSFRLSCKAGPLVEGSELSAKMQKSLTKSFLPKIQPPFMLGLDSGKHSFKSSSCGDCELFLSFALSVPSCPEPGPEGELSPCSRMRPGSCSGLESPGRVTGCGAEVQGGPQRRGPGSLGAGVLGAASRGGEASLFALRGMQCCPQESPVCCVLLCA